MIRLSERNDGKNINVKFNIIHFRAFSIFLIYLSKNHMDVFSRTIDFLSHKDHGLLCNSGFEQYMEFILINVLSLHLIVTLSP